MMTFALAGFATPPRVVPARIRRPVLRAALLALGLVAAQAGGARAAEAMFAPGWTLVPEVSKLNFQSVKKQTKVETSKFASFNGAITPEGLATVKIQLDSVDTNVDLRNVRMRFLFFETFKFPEATVTLQLDPATLADLAAVRRMPLPVSFELDLHGIKRRMETEVVVTLLTDDLVSVASGTPISVGAAEFGLSDGIKKLEEAASVTVIPSGTVSFDFMFRRNGPAPGQAVVAAAPAAATPAPAPTPSPTPAAQAPASTAVEATGTFSTEACAGRFEIISRTGAIYFASGSARLDAESRPLLNSLVDIVQRCPDFVIQVAGHTDSVGSAGLNQRLSEARARSVTRYLVDHGVAPSRLRSVGFGETRPVAGNDTAWNRSRNRRIEFSIAGTR